MARVTIEDCLEQVPTRLLYHLAAKRVRQIYRGAPVLVKGDNKEIVMAVREIAAAKIVPTTPLKALPNPKKNNPHHYARTCRCRPAKGWRGSGAPKPPLTPLFQRGNLAKFH